MKDNIRTVGQYVIAIVLLHSDAIINGGNGAKEHPTQGSSDLLTLIKELDTIHSVVITCVSDLKFGRTVRSLCELDQHYANVAITVCSSSGLEIPLKLIEQIRDRGKVGVVSAELTLDMVGDSDVTTVRELGRSVFPT